MTNSAPTVKSAVFDEAIVIDGCSVEAAGWHERIESSGVTVLQSAITWPRDSATQALKRIQRHRDIFRDDERLTLVRTVEDIKRCKAEGRVGHVLGSHSTDMLGRDTSLVEVFRDAGLRVMQLIYNERNMAADGSLEKSNAGLSHFGRELIHAMNEAGVLIDLVDTGINSSLEAIEQSSKPCVFSRLNPRGNALEQQRNITDEQIKALAAKGGVVGLVAFGPLCARTVGEWPTMADYISHIDYVVDLVGIDHVAIGTDSEATPGSVSPELALQMGEISRMGQGGDGNLGEISTGMGMRKKRTKQLGYFEMAQALQHGGWGAKGFESVEKLPDLANALTAAGWSDEHLQKLLGGNLMRVYEANWSTD